jgi:hypothetical protein
MNDGVDYDSCVCVCVCVYSNNVCSSSDEDEADYNTHDLYVGLNE